MYMYMNNHQVHLLTTDEYTYTMYFMNIHVPYSLNQMPLSNRSRPSRCAERNSGRSRIVAARVTHAHVDKPHGVWLARLMHDNSIQFNSSRQEQVRSFRIRHRLPRCHGRDQIPLPHLQCWVYIENVGVVWGQGLHVSPLISINAALNWSPLSNRHHTKLGDEKNSSHGVWSSEYGSCS